MEATPPAQARDTARWGWADTLLCVAAALVAVILVGSLIEGIMAARHLSGSDRAYWEQVANGPIELSIAGAVVVTLLLRGRATLVGLGFRHPQTARPWAWYLAAPLIGLALVAASAPLVYVTQRLFPTAGTDQCSTVSAGFGGHPALVAVAVVSVLVPVAEETFFRAFVFGSLRRYLPAVPAMVLSAVLFSAAHAQPALSLALFVVGLTLVAVYRYCGSLWPGIIVHGTFNLVGILAILDQGCH